jgi:hypothetical protein
MTVFDRQQRLSITACRGVVRTNRCVDTAPRANDRERRSDFLESLSLGTRASLALEMCRYRGAFEWGTLSAPSSRTKQSSGRQLD